MSVIIKGVEMPSKCWSCPCCVDNGLIGRDREYFCSALDSDFEIDNLEQRLSACPLKEVPTLHGRLIDADELKKNMRNYYPSIDHLCCSQHVVTKRDIDCAPTIIEAEVSKNA